MQIKLDEVKSYLKIEDTSEDNLIQTLINAAISHCETVLNRPILDKNMSYDAWTVPESIRIAIYLLISHWYENRSPVGQVTGEIALSVSAILSPHRFRNV